MNPYRTNAYNHGTVETPLRWYQRRMPAWLGALVILSIASGVQAQTKPLRVNGVKIGATDNDAYAPVFACKADGSTDDTTCLQNAITAATVTNAGVVRLPTGNYKTTGTLTLTSGVSLVGAGINSTTITYTGTGAAVVIQNSVGSRISDLAIWTTSNNAGVRGIDIPNAAGAVEFSTIENVYVVQNFTPNTPIAGQVGILLESTDPTNANYWNTIRNCKFSGWDKAMRAVGVVAQAPNENFYINNTVYRSEYGVDISSYVTESTVDGLMGSGSGYSGTALLLIGDGTNITSGVHASNIVSEQGGVTAKAYLVQANASGNYITVNNNNVAAGVDNGTGTTIIHSAGQYAQFPKIIIPSTGALDTIAAGTFPIGGNATGLNLKTSILDIVFANNASSGAPTFTTKSAGEKIALFPGPVDASHANYAIGVEASNMWFGTPIATSQGFKWYGGTTLGMQLVVSTGILTTTAGFNSSGASLLFQQGGTTQWSINSSATLFPKADNTAAIGTSSLRASQVWGVRMMNGTQNLGFSATPAFDCTAGNTIHIGTITANVTGPTMVAGAAGETCTIIFLKDATAGTFTINGWGANTRTAGTMTFAATASQVFVITFRWDDRLGTVQWVEQSRVGPI